jgi:hypothetical protein
MKKGGIMEAVLYHELSRFAIPFHGVWQQKAGEDYGLGFVKVDELLHKCLVTQGGGFVVSGAGLFHPVDI